MLFRSTRPLSISSPRYKDTSVLSKRQDTSIPKAIWPTLGKWTLFLFCSAGSAAATSAEPAPARPSSLPVLSVHIEGNSLLSESTLAALLQEPSGNEVRSLEDLRRTATRIESAYTQAGYGGVVAYVPAQSLSSGKAVIRVVEGKIAKVRIKGEENFYSADNVRRSLPALQEGTTPVIKAIDRDIQLTNENSAKNLRVTLAAGAAPGEIDADIEVSEKNPLRFMASLDNTGTPQTGDYRLGVGVQHTNLFNLDHTASAQFQTSPSKPNHLNLYSLGYRVPFYGYASSLDVFYAYSNVSTGTTSTTAGPLTFTGKGTVFGLRATHYLDRMGEYDHRITLGGDWRKYNNDCSLGTFGSAGCGSAGADVRVAPLSLAYVGHQQTPSSTWGVNLALSHNIGGSNQHEFTAARVGAKRHYTIGRLSAFAEIPLKDGYALAARTSVQYSPHALVSGEQFGLGGIASVRGYRERELSGDYGYFASLEALGSNLPVSWLPDTYLRPLVFIDQGVVSNHNAKPCLGTTEQRCSLSSIGVGVRLAAGKNANLRLEVGRALENSMVKSAGSTRGHLAINLAY